jgi:hypothetical protein
MHTTVGRDATRGREAIAILAIVALLAPATVRLAGQAAPPAPPT